jgi:hypothetical protein
MIGRRDGRAENRCAADATARAGRSPHASRHRAAASAPPGGRPAIAAVVLLSALVLQCVEPRAELLFRSAEQINGEQRWSALKNYADPSDTAYLRAPADGAPVQPEEVQVFLHNDITAADVYGAKVMENLVKMGRQKIAGNVVSFASKGGEVDAAMELGRVLRKLGVSTLVAEGDQCLSSCVFAFMGGDRRAVEGRLGIHRPYFSSAREAPDRRSHYRQLQKKLQAYIEELDFPPSLYEAVMAVPPQSVTVLTAAELKKFYLEGMSPSAEDEAYAASARALGISVAEYLQQKAPPCASAQVVFGPCEGEARKAAGSGAAADAKAEQQAGEGTSENPAVGRAPGPQ